MKLILFDIENGGYMVEKTKDVHSLNEVFWDDQSTIIIYCEDKNEKNSILKLKEFAINYHRECIEKLKK